ncbi:MAG TPA: DUF6468 domain-containing protein [Parvibaculum sp.]|uniref:DUF6468 domain-containing protein n=1 Tax=Parvibaculum sp. TaxID=2024848 RepID=UPI002BDD5384|nr:DUF6468 domain-containing protein [Parvibaculum sp.]HMM13718.1 DUF6468 domain-containing protein [Parvibaculum sp.]
MNLPIDLMLEAIVCVLLAATIGYCATLDKRLRAMRSGQDGLRQLIGELSVATEQAAGAIARLREATDATGQALGEQVKRGRALADELGLMVEAGNRIADRLSAPLEQRRMPPPPMPAKAAPQLQPAAGPRQVAPAAQRETKTASVSHPLLDLLKRAR